MSSSTAMVAVSFGSSASAALADGSTLWIKDFAVLLVLTILRLFAVTTLANLDLDLLALSGYPRLSDIVSSVALTFFAFLGFGVITFTGRS